VGDFVGKGPESIAVLDFVKDLHDKGQCVCVIGNHDEFVLTCYEAFQRGENPTISDKTHKECALNMTSDHYKWLKSLPYYLELKEMNVIVVHAGLDPSVSLTQQTEYNMTHMRSIKDDGTVTSEVDEGTQWASLWPGPQLVVFGHDAGRGLQQFNFAIGLDTGCCYGNKLTAWIMPDRQFVSVQAHRQYSIPTKKLG